MVVEMLWKVGGFNMDRGAELTLVNADFDVQECDMGLPFLFIKL